MREPHLAMQSDLGATIGPALALTHGQSGPLADAVGGQDGGPPRRRGEKRRGRMGRMMVREQDLVPRHSKVGLDDAADPYLLAEHVLQRMRKRPPRARECPQ